MAEQPHGAFPRHRHSKVFDKSKQLSRPVRCRAGDSSGCNPPAGVRPAAGRSLAGTGRPLCARGSDLPDCAMTERSHHLQHLTRLTGPRVFLKRSLFSSSKRARVRGSERSTPSARDSISTRTWGVEDKHYSARREVTAEGQSGAPIQRLPSVFEDHVGRHRLKSGEGTQYRQPCG